MVDDTSTSPRRIAPSASADAAPGPTVSLAERLAWTLAELSALTGISERQLRRLDSDRQIPGRLTCGRKVLFAAETIREWVRSGMPGRGEGGPGR
jgi:hypothetical protein